MFNCIYFKNSLNMELPEKNQPHVSEAILQTSHLNPQQPSLFPVTSNQQNPNTVTVGNGSESGRIYHSYPAKCGMGLAVTQFVIGVLCIISHILLYASGSPKRGVSQGIWGGLYFIMTGSFGIAAAKKRTICFIVSFMVLSISTVPITGGVGAASAFELVETIYIAYEDDGFDYFGSDTTKERTTIVADAILITVSLTEFVTGIISAGICCRGVCCYREQPIVIAEMQYADGQITQVVVLQPEQGAVRQSGTYVPQISGAGMPANNEVGEQPKKATQPYSPPT